MTPRDFWPYREEWWWIVLGLVIGAGTIWAALRTYAPRGIAGASVSNPYHLKLIEWERDRVFTAAKGLASTAVGFLGAALTALVKDDIWGSVSVLSILGCLLGAIGVLLLAIHWSLAASRFVRNPTADAGP